MRAYFEQYTIVRPIVLHPLHFNIRCAGGSLDAGVPQLTHAYSVVFMRFLSARTASSPPVASRTFVNMSRISEPRLNLPNVVPPLTIP